MEPFIGTFCSLGLSMIGELGVFTIISQPSLQQKQLSRSPKFLGSVRDLQHNSQGRPHLFFSTILSYLKSFALLFS
jgi:hypothetical protein